MTNTMQIRKASRKQAKIKLGLSAPSGAGKTLGALKIAYGLAGGDWSKVCVIDTENNSADLYSHLGGYDVLPLSAPYSPERYVDAIRMVENAGYEVCIVDSITHEWDGEGGILDIKSKMSGDFRDWNQLTPRHDKFIKAIVECKCHIITTVRRKQEYAMVTNEMGKTKVQKLGLKEITREGFDYELTVNLSIDKDSHMVTVLKDRTELFEGKPEFIITEDTGRLIKEWCELGIDPLAEVNEALERLRGCKSVEEMTSLKTSLPAHVVSDEKFQVLGRDIYQKLTQTNDGQ